ncbi:MAG: tRNA preQ1(34) S-adenosylmethionine ribosyltransferase-isomerase QueA [Planctomycetota bacterium]|nr:tRNA preQ1(34) S-adenosylmethionine ribosyltransferase-isomerase QueA [Planctomycetota bacterium]
MLRTDALDYHLPPEQLATHPVEPRDSARLLVIRRNDPERFEHAQVRDLPDLLDAGDRLVLNTTRVLPARFLGYREDTGGKVEGLYLHDAQPTDPTRPSPPVWLAMLKARRHKPGSIVRLLRAGKPTPYTLRMIAPEPDPPGTWRVEVHADRQDIPLDAPSVLEAVGLTPLPPYILAARRAASDPGDDPTDRAQYQTVYAGAEEANHGSSVAAPTAGLHFTPTLLDHLADKHIARTDVQLHVGAGTFKPVETTHVEDHPIHAEWCTMSSKAVGEITRTRAAGCKVVAVGTTSVRTIESYAVAIESTDPQLSTVPSHLSTRLLLTPGCPLIWTDALLTNFHLPRSTLMALVAAMLQHPDEPPAADATPPGVARLKAAYHEAIAKGYRFYSFGDAMLIL